MNANRRYFLKVAGLSTFALAAGVGASAAKAVTAAKEAGDGSYKVSEQAVHGKRFAMVIDTRKFETEEDMLPIIEHAISSIMFRKLTEQRKSSGFGTTLSTMLLLTILHLLFLTK